MTTQGNPTKKRAKRLYKKWVKYLSDSRLPPEEVKLRARKLTYRKEKIPS